MTHPRQRFFKRHENEPVQRFHELFQAPLNASHAAAAVGLETVEFLTQINEKTKPKKLGITNAHRCERHCETGCVDI